MTEQCCFICLEQADATHPYATLLCKCKGSLQLHMSCYIRLRGTHNACPNCKTPYPTTDIEYENGLPVKTYIDGSGYTHRYTYETDESIPHGTYTIYYPCGALESLRTFRHGMHAHITRKWNERGVLLERYTYLDGQLNSYYYRWDEHGKIIDVRTYYENTMCGRHYIFNSSSRVKIHMYKYGNRLNYEVFEPVANLPAYINVDWRTAESQDLL